MIKRAVSIYLFAILLHIVSYAQTDNTHLRFFISEAEVAMDNQRPDEAVSQLKNAVSIAPDNFVPLYMLGQVYIYLNDNSNAAKYYTKALNLINANTISQKYYECYGTADDVSYRNIMTNIYEVLAEYYKNVGQIGLAKRYNNLNIQLNIASGYKIPVLSALEQIYFCYAEECKWAECLDYFTEIQIVIPNCEAWKMCEALCHAAIGDCYANLNQESKMISEYQQAAKLGHPGAIHIINNMGLTY